MIYDECQTDIGRLRFVLRARIFLTDDHWLSFVEDNAVKKSTELGKPIRKNFKAYFSGDRKISMIPIER